MSFIGATLQWEWRQSIVKSTSAGLKTRLILLDTLSAINR